MRDTVTGAMPALAPVHGRFWRIVFAARLPQVLEGVSSPEGRLHHSGQKALYLSPQPDWAAMAVDAYLRPGDPPRVLVELEISGALVADLREPETCAALGITTATAGVPWQPERARGRRATSWAASDAVRAGKAHGLIYPARSWPERWHMVLHSWNVPGGAQVALSGPVRPWSKPGL